MIDTSQKLENSIDKLISKDYIRLSRREISEYSDKEKSEQKTILDYLDKHIAERGNKVAFIDDQGGSITFKELGVKSTNFGVALQQLGIVQDDRVAIQLPNSIEFVIALLGISKIAAIPVLCHVPYNENDLDYVFSLTEAKGIIVRDQFNGNDFVSRAKKVQQTNPSLQHIIAVGLEGNIGDVIRFEDCLKETDRDLKEYYPVATDFAFILFTSGTTGKPKAVTHLYATNILCVKTLDGALEMKEGSKLLVVPPTAHLTALAVGVLMEIYNGQTSILLSGWNTQKCLDLIEKEKPTHFLGVTPMLMDLVNAPNIEERDLSSLQCIMYAGAPCPAPVLSFYEQRYQCDIVAFYGYSEGGVTHTTKLGDDISITSRSFGRIADGIESKIIDENGEVVIGAGVGEVVSRGPNFTPGYYKQPHVTQKSFDHDGWFLSSDIVQMDENSYGTFLARKDDLINRGGYKIDPREVEEALYTHPKIKQCVVIAKPDERLGERIAAIAILHDPSETLTLEEVVSYVAEKGINKKHWPEVIKTVDSFPMTASGKIQRFMIKQQL